MHHLFHFGVTQLQSLAIWHAFVCVRVAVLRLVNNVC